MKAELLQLAVIISNIVLTIDCCFSIIKTQMMSCNNLLPFVQIFILKFDFKALVHRKLSNWAFRTEYFFGSAVQKTQA